MGQTYVLDTSGDWDIRCVRAPEGQQDNCTMFQLLRQANGNPIAEISVAPLPAGGDAVTGATLITPLGTLLQRGLLISVDGAEAKTYPFSYCTNVGCFARAGLTALDLMSFERGESAIVTIVSRQRPNEPIEIPVSLSGFTRGYDILLEQ